MKYFNRLDRFLGRLPRWAIITVAALILLVVGAIDYITGEEIGLSIFYVLPVMLMAWYLGRTAGIIMSITAAGAWYIADTAAGHVYSNAAIPVWNTVVRLGFFLLTGLFMSILKHVLGLEQDLARTDSLTGAVNSRYFYELAGVELARAKRYGHTFSIAYMDLDNFKEVNDVYGHSAGDELLCFIAATVRDNVRVSDVMARLGGDEFALLLPETKDGDAGKVVEKLCSLIKEGMPQYRFPVTLSVGLITYIALPDSVEDMIREVDDLMYSVKKGSKNAIKHAIIEDDTDRWRMILDQPAQGSCGREA
ncbi:MAG: diguanylate cyclase [Actinobacteria bacterium]|nr:diguanylate cyclase [Actinomycetota bacterium]